MEIKRRLLEISQALLYELEGIKLKDIKKNEKVSLKLLFFTTLYISAVTFGGGYVIVSIMKKKFADELKLIENEEILDLIAIAQSSPGAIAINASLLLGYKFSGVIGALVCALAAVLPPFIAMTVVGYFYATIKDNRIVRMILMGMQAGVAAIIIEVVISFIVDITKKREIFDITIAIIVFLISEFLDVNVMYIIIASAFIGLFRYYFNKGKEARV